MTSRYFRGEDVEGAATRRDRFDPIAEGMRFGLDPETSRQIWDRIEREGIRGNEQPGELVARQRFQEIAARVAARGGRLRPAPGRRTLQQLEEGRRNPIDDVFRSIAPGRTTLVGLESHTDAAADAAPVNRPGGDNRHATGGRSRRAPPTPALQGAVHRHTSTSGGATRVRRADLVALLAGSRGEPLPQELRGTFSRALGDVDDVRVHTDSRADDAARFLQAEAFAIGRNVYFARGTYDPASTTGQRLIAHEVAHTVQHAAVDTDAEVAVSAPGDANEQAADAFADAFVAATATAPANGSHVFIERPRLVRANVFGGVSRSAASPFVAPEPMADAIDAVLDRVESPWACEASGDEPPRAASPSAEDVASAARTGSGRALPQELAGRLEAATGRSLDHVRIHDDEAAGKVADSLGAAAFTHGADVFFAPGSYDPGSAAGREVIAHEVLHTLQPQASDATASVTHSTDAVEREADEFARGFVRDELERAAADRTVPAHAPRTIAPASAPRTRIPRYPGVVPSALEEDKVRLIDPDNPSEGKVWQRDRGYIKNPTATRLSDIVKNGKIAGGFENAKVMYVVDEAGEVWIGKRSLKNMPHPTLIGGFEPKVRAAGMVTFKRGKIVRIDNHSGHFRPPRDALRHAVRSYLKLPKELFKDLTVESLHFNSKGEETWRAFKSLRMWKLRSLKLGKSIQRVRMRYRHDPKFKGQVKAGFKDAGKAGLAILASLIAEYFIGKWVSNIEDELIRRDIQRLAPAVEAALQGSLEKQANLFDALYEQNPDLQVYFNFRYRIVYVELRNMDMDTNSYAGLDLISAEVAPFAIEEGVKPGGTSACIGSTTRFQDLSMREPVRLGDLYDGEEVGDGDAAGQERSGSEGNGTQAGKRSASGGGEVP